MEFIGREGDEEKVSFGLSRGPSKVAMMVIPRCFVWALTKRSGIRRVFSSKDKNPWVSVKFLPE